MARYARKLSIVGFALAVWYVYVLGSSLWQSRVGHSEVPDLFSLAALLGAIALPSGAAVLLRRLATPGPKRAAVRWLAQLWIALGLCGTVGFLLSLWTIATSGLVYAYLVSVSGAFSLAIILACAMFFLAILPPLWVLSRRPR